MEKMEWLEVGAEVVVCSLDKWTPTAHVTTVERVNKVTFTVKDVDGRRFSVNDGYSREDGSWTGSKVVPLGSAEGQTALYRAKAYRLRQAARNTYGVWNRKPTRANREAAIVALQSVIDDEG